MTKKIEKEEQIDTAAGNEIEIEYVMDKKAKPKTEAPAAGHLKAEMEKAFKAKLKKKNAELQKLKEEAADLKEKFLRIAAEKDNLIKRMDREKNEFYRHSLAEALREFLNVLDNFERALSSSLDTNSTSFREGVEMIYKQYLDVIFKLGVTPIKIEDNKFDPTVQQAFLTEESEDVEEHTVGEVLQNGYMLHDRLLRPAMVKVLVPKKEES